MALNQLPNILLSSIFRLAYIGNYIDYLNASCYVLDNMIRLQCITVFLAWNLGIIADAKTIWVFKELVKGRLRELFDLINKTSPAPLTIKNEKRRDI